MIDNYSGCEKCPLRDCPPVLGYGRKGGIVALGEAPGRNEVLQGKPFVGESGKLLRDTLKAVGIDPNEVYYTNACLCRPPDNATPTPKAVLACNGRLINELMDVNPRKILMLGGTALQAMISPGKIAKISENQGMGQWIEFGMQTVLGEEDLVEVPYKAFGVATYHPSAVLRGWDLFRDFASDTYKLATRDTPMEPTQVEVAICTEKGEIINLLDTLDEFPVVSCDLETTGFSYYYDQPISLGFGVFLDEANLIGYSAIIPFSSAQDPEVKSAVKRLLKSDKHLLVMHNFKFDLQFLQKWLEEEIQPPRIADTMLMQYAQDERGIGGDDPSIEAPKGRSYSISSLKTQVRVRYDTHYGFDFKKFFKLPEEERDYQTMYEYQALDVYFTLRLYKDLYQELPMESPKLLTLVERQLIPAARMFCEVEKTGIPIDVPYMEELLAEKKVEHASLKETLTRIAEAHGVPSFNPGSHVQVKKVLKDMGFMVPSTGKTELSLELEKGGHDWSPEVREFIETLINYRQVGVVISTYLEGVLNRLDPDGRVRPDVLIHGTDTGRIAYRDPNPQNQPLLMGPLIRDAYIAPPGYKLLLADYSQLELRVGAFYSQDPTMIQIFKDGRDIHAESASFVFGKPADQISKGERYAAKCLRFGVLYGRGAKSLVEGIEARILATEYNQSWTLKQAEEILEGILDSTPGFKEWIRKQHEFVHKYKYVESATGRRRRFPFIFYKNRGDVERRSVNTPIQGLASDINLDSAVRLHALLPKEGAWILFLVHDSIMVLCKEELVPQVAPLMVKTMETIQIIDPGEIPFKVDLEWGDRWGHLKKWEG